MAFYQLHKTQKVNCSIDDIWAFISSPRNLKEITPDYMGFDITSKDTPEIMYPGLIITYKVRSGETLGDIAGRYNISVRDIATLNRLSGSARLRAGQVIKVPVRSGR